ncbi:unnamed protein product [Caenorhabditis angaria]|uniref:Uncharacterized protein n=1 Tax=Caenorhabditis angaria TaxID=860376 RepID=A0A9P1IWH9_9PELO|nr:unnamed protein product [Caenorhabditis angaria]
MSDLLQTVQPTAILFSVDPDFSNQTYKGHVKIDYDVTGETSEVQIQTSSDFQIQDVRVALFYEFNQGSKVFVSHCVEDYTLENDILTIPMREPLNPEKDENGFYITVDYIGQVQGPGYNQINEETQEANLGEGRAHTVFPSYEGISYPRIWLSVYSDYGVTVDSNLTRTNSNETDGRMKHNFYGENQTADELFFSITLPSNPEGENTEQQQEETEPAAEEQPQEEPSEEEPQQE